MADEERYAPPGTIWVCGACGKVAEDRYGIDRAHSPGWDESCMLNSVLCKYPKGLHWEAVGGGGETKNVKLTAGRM